MSLAPPATSGPGAAMRRPGGEGFYETLGALSCGIGFAVQAPIRFVQKGDRAMHRIGVFVYGVLSYVCFLATFLYAVGFVGGFGVPQSIDSAAGGPLATAVLVDVLLLAAFALQHSVMARPAFKRWWTGIVPEPA